jgi:hypothetical protein
MILTGGDVGCRARVARDTQRFLQQDSGVTRLVDPWAGSYSLERLTHELMARAWAHIQEIEAMGGMVRAIEQGLPKRRIEEAAAARAFDRLGAGEKKFVWTEGSGHVITVDTGRERVLELTGEWLLDRAEARSSGSQAPKSG